MNKWIAGTAKEFGRRAELLRVAIYVPGMFHYKHYVNALATSGLQAEIIYSHKLSENPFSTDVKATNLFLKEYLMQAHQRLLKSFMLEKLLHVYHYIWESLAAAKRVEADVVIGMLHGSCGAVFEKAKKAGQPVVGDAVNLHPNDYYSLLENEHRGIGMEYKYPSRSYRARMREIELIDYLLSPSQAVTDSYVKNGFPVGKIITLPYGSASTSPLDTDKVSNVKGIIKVLCVARVILRKGHHLAIRALKEHAVDRVDLTLVGDADEHYLGKLREIGLPFQHIRHVPHADVIRMMQAFDVLLLSSIEDGFGMVVTEALSAGLSVAVSKYAGASEIIKRSGGGVVFDPYHSYEIWDAVQRCKKRDFPPLSLPLRSWTDYASDLTKWLRTLK